MRGIPDYLYYAKPEGTDPVGKVLSVVKYSLPLSVVVAARDIFLLTNCQTVMHALGRAAFWMAPINGIAIAFPCGVFISTRLRGRDDFVNSWVGALACSPIFNAWLKPPFHMKVNIAFATLVLTFVGRRFVELPYRPRYAPPMRVQHSKF